MKATETIIEGQSSIFTKEASPELVITEETPMVNHKYRMLTEDEILGLNGPRIVWSDRMEGESNCLCRLRYSRGKVTQSFINGVIECLEDSGDFQITSFGHSKFILFVAGNRPLIDEDLPTSPHVLISYLHIREVERLSKHFEEILSEGESNSYVILGSGRHLSKHLIITLFVTLKPNIFFFMKTWGRE